MGNSHSRYWTFEGFKASLEQGNPVFYQHPRRGRLQLKRLYRVAVLTKQGHQLKNYAEDLNGIAFQCAVCRLQYR